MECENEQQYHRITPENSCVYTPLHHQNCATLFCGSDYKNQSCNRIRASEFHWSHTDHLSKLRRPKSSAILFFNAAIFHISIVFIATLTSVASNDVTFSKKDIFRRVSLPTPAPTKGCRSWCQNHPTPWFDTNPNNDQKCKWPKNCGGCPQCFPTQSPLFSLPPTSEYPCLTWCENHAMPWFDPNNGSAAKCNWKERCAGCPQCFESDDTSSPTQFISTKPSLRPSQYPTVMPSYSPTATKTDLPTSLTLSPTGKPTLSPTKIPTSRPTQYPTDTPIKTITSNPTSDPTKKETANPTIVKIMKKNASLFIRLQVSGAMDNEEKDTLQAITENFLKDRDSIKEANVKDIAVKVEQQVLRSIVSGGMAGIEVIDENDFPTPVDRRNLFSQAQLPFLFVELSVEGEVAQSFPFESTIIQVVDVDLQIYAQRLKEADSFFEAVDAYYEDPSDDNVNVIGNTLSDPLSVTAIVVGGLTGSLVMLVAGAMLIRRQSGNSDNWRKSKSGFQRFSSRKDPIKNEKEKDKPDIDHVMPIKEQNPYPQSINFSSQDSFSTITFSEYKGGSLMSQKNHDKDEQWENPLKQISENSDENTPDKQSEERPGSINSDGRSKSVSVKSLSEYLAAGKQLHEISASPGPLGLVVKSSDDGPVVCEINADSPLEGKLHLGDIVVSVNNIDVRHMSAIAFAKYIVSKEQESERLIAVLRTMKMFEMSV